MIVVVNGNGAAALYNSNEIKKSKDYLFDIQNAWADLMTVHLLVASYVSVYTETWFSHPAGAGFCRWCFLMWKWNEMSEPKKQSRRNKGGRPRKAIKQKEVIPVKCSLVEKIMLKQKAKAIGVPLSEYLRQGGLNGQAVSKTKAFQKKYYCLLRP